MRRGALALYPFSRPVSGSEAVTPALSLLKLCSGFMICVNRTGLHANVCWALTRLKEEHMFSWVLGLKASLVFLRPTSLLYFLKIPVLIVTLSFRLGANFAFIKTVASMKVSVFSRVCAPVPALVHTSPKTIRSFGCCRTFAYLFCVGYTHTRSHTLRR